MDKRLYNRLFARLLLKHRRATKEQIQSCWSALTPDTDLGRLMVANGMLSREHLVQLNQYIRQLRNSPDFQQKAAEILGTPAAFHPRPTTDETVKSPPAESVASGGEETMPSGPKAGDTPNANQGLGLGISAVVRQSMPKSLKSLPPAASQTKLPQKFKGQAGKGGLRRAVPTSPETFEHLDDILLYARKINASDVHLSPGSPVLVRRFGTLKPLSREVYSLLRIQKIVETALTSEQLHSFKATGDLETAYSIEGGGRFRVTLMEQRFGWELTARVIPTTIRSFEDSGLSASCAELTKWAQGLVLITGPLGSGKSSTLVTLVELINRDRSDHIITMEKPVEMVLEPKYCQITQREIGRHTLSQGNALRAALREDPDILVIGELRGLENIRLAISAAERGLLVFATMNTANVIRTINRLIDSFPPEEQEAVRNMISETLRGVISQQLVPLKDGSGMVPAYEVLIVTNAVSNLIRKKNTHQLGTIMLTGKNDGMVLLDESLQKLVDDGLISGEEAFSRATLPKNFKQYAPQELQELIDARN